MKNDELFRIEFSNRFNKDRKAASHKVKVALREALDIFYEDPVSKTLRNHSLAQLGKRYHGLWSINVTDDYRAIYRKEGTTIVFIMLRTHEQLYGK
ncbi:MAG: type II toxin-antitoxin system RelE/ParE family toxin [Candidatus Levyibacteriota bacterium]